MDIEYFTLRMSAALLSGLFIGIEREIMNKNAGLKTNALVALGAAVFVYISMTFAGTQYVDVTRVLGQVVTGIGFIGAGVILHRGTTVKGLTTAATIWCSAGAGCLAALGLFQELTVLTILIVFVNVIFGKLDSYINRKLARDPDEKVDD